MDAIQIVVLALIQGLTEFLPISSSGHLLLPKEILGWPDQGLAFDVAVHMGSLLAVVGYFRHDVVAILSDWGRSLVTSEQTLNSRMGWYVIAATFPGALAGLLASDFIEANLRSIEVIATTTIVFGLLLGWADRRHGNVELEQITLALAIAVGMAQILALVPGTSRSGITITAALALGFSRYAAARFSFLLSMPIILLSGGYETYQLLHEPKVHWGEIVAGVVLAFISALLCIHVFLKFIERIGMMPFVIYRLLLGAVLVYLSIV